MKALLTLLIGFSLVFISIGGQTNETTTASGEQLWTRAYKVSADAFVRNLKKLATPKPGESAQDLFVRFLKEQHIDVQKPAAVFLDEKKGTLVVTTTQADQRRIETLIGKIVDTK